MENKSYKVSLAAIGDEDFSGASLSMNASRAAIVLIYALHMSKFFFCWGDQYSKSFNLTGVLESKYGYDACTESCFDDDTHPKHMIAATELLNLLPPTNMSNQKTAEYFLDAAMELYYNSLSGAVNISLDEATMEFSHVDISDTIRFEAVTFEVPLRKNFYYRRLNYNDADEELVEDYDSAENYTSLSSTVDTDGDNYYDLDISTDCGPNPGVCVMPLVQEYDINGEEYMPDPQIKATAVCLNSNGTEDFYVIYDNYDTGLANLTDYYWACPRTSTTAMWVVSLSSRIVGDAMYDSASPSDKDETMNHNRNTIVNPRKVYSLTMGMLQWDNADIAEYHNADCGANSGDCKGIDIVLDVPVKGSYAKSNSTQHLIVGESSIPTNELSAYPYNNTDQADVGYGSAPRWLPLMTLATPSEDSLYMGKGNILFSSNFKSYKWTSGSRAGYNC